MLTACLAILYCPIQCSQLMLMLSLALHTGDEDVYTCGSSFKADKVFGGRREQYDQLGIAAVVCRHEFVLSMCSMPTDENFTYYNVMFADLLNSYCAQNERSIQFMFMDIACRLAPTYRK